MVPENVLYVWREVLNEGYFLLLQKYPDTCRWGLSGRGEIKRRLKGLQSGALHDVLYHHYSLPLF